jgi:hypothetical protein
MYPDYTLNAQPLIVDLVEDAFGPQQGRQVLVDNRTAVSVDPGIENELMDEGIYMEVHPMDNDVEHSFAHKASIEKDGDDTGAKMMHLKKHEQQIVVKTMAQKMALNPQGQGGGAPGQGGSTPPGAQPRGPQGPQKPAGTIPQDQMQDPSVMPRKM